MNVTGYEDYTREQLRAICKSLMLFALNAKNEKTTYKAFRAAAEPGSPEKRLKDNQLKVILDALRAKHSLIESSIASDAGIDLMRSDLNLANYVIRVFLAHKEPALCIHDSFIVPQDCAQLLHETMQYAIELFQGTYGKVDFSAGELERSLTTVLSDRPPLKTERYLKSLENFRLRATAAHCENPLTSI